LLAICDLGSGPKAYLSRFRRIGPSHKIPAFFERQHIKGHYNSMDGFSLVRMVFHFGHGIRSVEEKAADQ
jgi:hypothetical protein